MKVVVFKRLTHLSTKYKYTESIAVCVPSSELGPPHHPPPASECALCTPLNQRRGEHTCKGGEGVVESQFGRLEKKPSTLSTLCTHPSVRTARTTIVYLRNSAIVRVSTFTVNRRVQVYSTFENIEVG